VQRRGQWVRLLTSIPVDGWLAITPDGSDSARSIAVHVSPLEGQVVTMAGESYRILRIAAGTVEYRREIPSDYGCGESAIDPVPLPQTLRTPVASLFDPEGTPRFRQKYTRGC